MDGHADDALFTPQGRYKTSNNKNKKVYYLIHHLILIHMRCIESVKPAGSLDTCVDDGCGVTRQAPSLCVE